MSLPFIDLKSQYAALKSSVDARIELENSLRRSLRNGDLILLDAEAGTLDAVVPAAEWATRTVDTADLSANWHGTGRELFGGFRRAVTGAEQGAMSFGEF